MKAIYEPTGKAREFGDLACNLYRGCSHGCWYCYAPGVLRIDRKEFIKPVPRPGILEALAKDAKKYAGSRIPIFLCFTCDPYMPEASITMQALHILHDNGCAINILTKGGTRACPDFDLLSVDQDSWFGTSLTYRMAGPSRRYEPRAAIPLDRIDAMKKAKEYGIKTWVSLEPIISRNDLLGLINMTIGFTDLYKIGKMNHRKGMDNGDLSVALAEAVKILEAHGKDYYIKLDTRLYLR